MSSLAVSLRVTTAGAFLALALAAVPRDSLAQGRLDASYTISLARIGIGNAKATAEFGDDRYAVAASGRARGLMRIFASGEGTLSARGSIDGSRAVPMEFIARTTTDDDTLDVKLAMADGNVTELSASQPKSEPDRVPLTDAHRRGILDPLTALLLPATADGNGAGEAACQRTLAIFDGRRRFDLKLAFRRMDKAKAEQGYAGPVVVCAVAFHAVAGHRPASAMVRYLSDGRDIEIAFAPIAGTRMLAPLRVTIANLLGNLVVQADRFEVTASPSARAASGSMQ